MKEVDRSSIEVEGFLARAAPITLALVRQECTVQSWSAIKIQEKYKKVYMYQKEKAAATNLH